MGKLSTRKIVKDLLRESTTNRNDDKLLRLRVWGKFGFELTDKQRLIYWNLPADGAIVRRRREFRGDFPESSFVRDKRFNKFQEKRDYYSTGGFWKRMFRHL